MLLLNYWTNFVRFLCQIFQYQDAWNIWFLFFFSTCWNLLMASCCLISYEAFLFGLWVHFFFPCCWNFIAGNCSGSFTSLPLSDVFSGSDLSPGFGWLPGHFSAWDFVCLLEEDSITSCPKHSKGRVRSTNSQGSLVYFFFLTKAGLGTSTSFTPPSAVALCPVGRLWPSEWPRLSSQEGVFSHILPALVLSPLSDSWLHILLNNYLELVFGRFCLCVQFSLGILKKTWGNLLDI